MGVVFSLLWGVSKRSLLFEITDKWVANEGARFKPLAVLLLSVLNA